MEKFYAIEGQSLADVCMNTYGSMDYFFKMLQDSGVQSANEVPYTGQIFLWEKTLVVDAQVNRTTTINNIKYATASSQNGNTYYIINGDGITPPQNGNGQNPNPPTVPSMYQKTSELSYVAPTDNVTDITLTSLQGKNILQIIKNIQPLFAADYSFNTTTGVLHLITPLSKDEALFILYTEMITL